MLRRVRGLGWRQVLRKPAGMRGFVAVAIIALLATGLVTSGALVVRAIQPGAASRAAARMAAQRPDPKAEGRWFQLSHVGRSSPVADARARALRQAAALPRSPLGGHWTPSSAVHGSTSALTASPGGWNALGPQSLSMADCVANDTCDEDYGLVSGRVTALAVDPSDAQDVWAGAADGGLWHSTDGGAQWVPITDGQSTLSIGSIAIDAATTPHTIYVGTGESNFNGDAYLGDGILKVQVNSGTATVTPLASSYFAGLSVGKLAVLDPDPNNGGAGVAARRR